MLQITSNHAYSTPLKNSVNFGTRYTDSTESYRGGKSAEEIKAEKLERLAQKAKESGNPSAMKSFTIVAALMSASALTASALSRRFFNFLNGMGTFKKISTGSTVLLDKLGEKLSHMKIADKTGIKAKLHTYSQKAVEGLQKLSKNGVEDQLNKEIARKSRKLASIKRAIVKANEKAGIVMSKEELKLAVQKEIENNPQYKQDIAKINNTIKDIKGSNLLKKATTATAATVAGTGALTEASKDVDNDGIPDCIQNSRADREATQKFTAAVIDCALDSF